MLSVKSLWAMAFAWCAFFVFAVSVIAMGDPVIEPATGVPTISDWLTLVHALGDLKGMSTLGIVAVVVQALMLLARSSLDPLPGPVKITVVTGLTIVLGLISLKTTTGMSWGMALTSTTTLSAVQVYIHQLYQQFFTPPATPVALTPPK